MKTLLAAAVSAVLLASGTVAFAETPSASAPKIEQKAAVKAPASNVSVESKATKVEEKGKTVQIAQDKGKSADSKGKAETKGTSADKGQPAVPGKSDVKGKSEEKGKK
jgi:hypothetical protein